MLHHNYRASGIAPASGIVLYAAAGFVGCALIEMIYVYLVGFLSNLFLRLVVQVGTLVLLSLWQLLLIRTGKIRNTRIVRGIAIAILVLAYYFSRCVYVNMAQGFFSEGSAEVQASVLSMNLPVMNWLKLMINPGAVLGALVNILPYGLFSIHGFSIKGVVLLVIWLLEAAILLLVPYFVTVYYASRPYDERMKVWYTKKEEWPVVYVSNYREIRSQMRKGNCAALLDAMKDLKGYQMRGQESYGIIEFYMHGKFVGPFVTLTNVKAVQSGPRKLDHRIVAMCRLFDIGYEEAAKLRDQVMTSYEAAKRALPESDGQKLGDKISMAQVQVSRAGVNVATELRKNGTEKQQAYEVKPSVSFDTVELPKLDDVSIHVPRVTPEMEKEYLKRKQKDR